MYSFNNDFKDNICYYKAISWEEPISRPIYNCKKKTIILHLADQKEKKFIKSKSISFLRKKRILRISKEAFTQGVLLTHDDLALLLCTSLSTIKRDLKSLNKEGYVVPTRGFMKNVGKGKSFNSQIITYYKKGLKIKQISNYLYQNENRIRNTIEEYNKVIGLYNKKIPLKNIHILTKLSLKLINEYLEIYLSSKK